MVASSRGFGLSVLPFVLVRWLSPKKKRSCFFFFFGGKLPHPCEAGWTAMQHDQSPPQVGLQNLTRGQSLALLGEVLRDGDKVWL